MGSEESNPTFQLTVPGTGGRTTSDVTAPVDCMLGYDADMTMVEYCRGFQRYVGYNVVVYRDGGMI